MHAGQQLGGVLAGGALQRLVDIQVLCRAGVRLPPVGDHLRAGLDVLDQEGAQRLRGGVGDRGHPAAPKARGLLALHGDADQHLLALLAPATQPRLLAADVGLIDLHVAVQPLAARAHQHRAQAVEHRPRRLVGADLKRALQRQRRDPVPLA